MEISNCRCLNVILQFLPVPPVTLLFWVVRVKVVETVTRVKTAIC